MIDLLINDFLKSFHLRNIKSENVVPKKHKGSFVLFDEKACMHCLHKSCTNKGEKEVACFDCGEKEVLTIEYEKFIDQYNRFKAIQGPNCDYIHYSQNKNTIVLNELTCSQEKYINHYQCEGKQRKGKRNHAIDQINHTIDILYQVPRIAQYIDCFKNKIGLFSCRLASSIGGNESQNTGITSMQVFMRPIGIISNIRGSDPLKNGFIFEQRIYPEVYRF